MKQIKPSKIVVRVASGKKIRPITGNFGGMGLKARNALEALDAVVYPHK